MKPIILILIAAFMSLSMQAGKEITVKHTLYVTHWNPSTDEPDSVSWNLNAASVNCLTHLPRTNDFIGDPRIPGSNVMDYYVGSGYDQGHQMSAQDNSCSAQGEKECWYMSNMVPQCPSLNRIVWLALETWCRKEAAKSNLHIVCGVIGTLGKMTYIKTTGKKPNQVKTKLVSPVNIPEFCYKAIYENHKWTAYIMPNQDSVKKHDFAYYSGIHSHKPGSKVDIVKPYTMADLNTKAHLSI
jgi:endonuclease G